MKSAPPPFASTCHCTILRQAMRKVTQLYDMALAPSGLKVTQFSLLAELNRRREIPPTMGELADAMAMDRSTLGHNLRPLERDRLVEIGVSAQDRRSRRLRLTADGARLFAENRGRWMEAQALFEAAFGVERSGKLQRLLREVTATDYGVNSLSAAE